MHFEDRSRHLLSYALGALSLLLWAPAAQAQSQPTTVQLISDACPVVHGGDKIAFNWNPTFDPEWPVTGLTGVTLQFGRQEENSVNLVQRFRLTLGGRISSDRTTATATTNGYYHLEIKVPSVRSVQPGVYHLVNANMNARVEEGYNGPAPQMTRSPVESRLCFTLRSAR